MDVSLDIADLLDSVTGAYSVFDPNVRADQVRIAELQAAAAQAAAAASKPNYTLWIIIGGSVVLVIVLILIFMKNGKS